MGILYYIVLFELIIIVGVLIRGFVRSSDNGERTMFVFMTMFMVFIAVQAVQHGTTVNDCQAAGWEDGHWSLFDDEPTCSTKIKGTPETVVVPP